MKKILQGFIGILEFIVIVYVIFVTSIILCRNKYGYTQYGNYTLVSADDYEIKQISNVKKGDLLIFQNSSYIETGELIYYYSVYNNNYVVKTGIVSDVKNDGYSILYSIDDNKDSVAASRVLGNAISIKNNFGTVMNILVSKIGFLLLVLLPILLIFIYQVYEFVILVKYENVIDSKEDENKSKQNKKNKKSEEVEELDIEESVI
jgi:hypothetical protein